MRDRTVPDDIVHNLRTAIIDGEGKLITSLNGSEWSPADLVAEIRRARTKR
jgi:cytochrome oxidase Cu insertion factor (SCO1/SenC/PrrC family)